MIKSSYMKPTKNQYSFQIEENSFSDEGGGLIRFKNSLTITDDSVQRNGTRYDIHSMDISEYKGQITANHSSKIDDIIGKAINPRKVANRRVVIDGIQFAIKESALARLTHDLIVNKYLTDFSIETIGPWPDEEGVYKDSKLIGLSAVVVGNNKSATLNSPEAQQIVTNCIEHAKEDGLDTSIVENNFIYYNTDARTNNETNNNKENDMSDTVVTPVTDAPKVIVEKPSEAPAQQAAGFSKEAFSEALNSALAPLTAKLVEVEQKVFDNSAQEPQFTKATNASIKKISGELSAMGYQERHVLQINAAWELLKNRNYEAGKKLTSVNAYHLEELQKAGKVSNSVTLGDFGNFVISPELLTDIEGHRSNFQTLLSRLNFRETLSLQMAWLKRDGDINMQEVEMCDDGADGNLKPISEYGASIEQSNLHELAAVTPVCNASTRFLAADLLGDVAAGYRLDFDRKRAQLFIARLQQAVNESGNTTVYNTASASVLNPLNSIIGVASSVAEEIEGGVWIFNTKTYYELLRRSMAAGINTDAGFGMFSTGAVRQLVGSDYIVVPNELMPTLDTAETKSFVVEGVTVTINQAMFYVDLSTFSGRTSGGLMYDLSTEAAYEDGEVVKSAFQRNELVLRGSFFRGGAIRDVDKVSGLSAPGVS